jgi:hypothetical protein
MTLFLLTHPSGSQAVVRQEHAHLAVQDIKTLSNDDAWEQSIVTVIRQTGLSGIIVFQHTEEVSKPKRQKKSVHNEE